MVVSWLNMGTVISNDMYIVPTGSPAPTATTIPTVSAVTSPYLLNSLQCGVVYDVYVRSQCGSSQYSSWGVPRTFFDMVVTNELTPMTQVDDNNDGTVIFNLNAIEAQLNSTNTLSYHTSLNDAVSDINPIANTGAFSVLLQSGVTTIYIHEDIPNGCDVVHTFNLVTLTNANVAVSCAMANSLCSTLGMPYMNTINGGTAEPGNYDCLGSQPNPTWFYIPVSVAGNIGLQISQTSVSGVPLDVDFICWGPFSDPTGPCSMTSLNSASEIACSYSTAAVENFNITSALPGQYYLMLVTNFSNQPGLITITQTVGAGQGGIDCTGLRLNAFLDSNANGIKEASEPYFPLGQFNYERNNDSVIHNITSPSGVYGIYDINPLNTYNVSYTIDSVYASNYALTIPSFSNISVVPGAGMQDYFFPVTVTQAYNDLAVAIIPNGQPRPGFNYTNTVVYSNLGPNTVSSGTVSFAKDPIVTITSNSEAGSISNAAGFSYDFSNLQPFESREIIVNMDVPTIPMVALGDLLTNTANVIPLTGDVAPENNSFSSTQVIIGSYDPNDKMESRGGQILISDFNTDDYLYYTVRFENTGSASALDVKVIDVLDDRLDENSLRMVNASHDYTLDRVGNALTWKFDHIMLPSTSQNANQSKGYVQFKVKPNPGFAVGDIIPNTASIFFDFNPAIVTNTFNSEFVSQLATNEFASGAFVFYPNPATSEVTILMGEYGGSISNITIFDMLGKNIISDKPVAGTASETIDLSGVSSGMYFLEVTSGNNSKTVKKLLIQ
jgi:fimbrial isopeptide formation D2 family protein